MHRGVIHDGETLHYIEKSDTNLSDISGEHFVYKHDDLLTNNTCGKWKFIVYFIDGIYSFESKCVWYDYSWI